jgi:CheY-like chemotaxis protein
VLSIEDNAVNTELLKRIFNKNRHVELFSATSGEEGIKMAGEIDPDVVLLDIHLPGMDGSEVLRQLRAAPKLKDVPVIIVSADAFASKRDQLLAEGAFRYVTKPIDVSELMRAMDAARAMKAQ